MPDDFTSTSEMLDLVLNNNGVKPVPQKKNTNTNEQIEEILKSLESVFEDL